MYPVLKRGLNQLNNNIDSQFAVDSGKAVFSLIPACSVLGDECKCRSVSAVSIGFVDRNGTRLYHFLGGKLFPSLFAMSDGAEDVGLVAHRTPSRHIHKLVDNPHLTDFFDKGEKPSDLSDCGATAHGMYMPGSALR